MKVVTFILFIFTLSFPLFISDLSAKTIKCSSVCSNGTASIPCNSTTHSCSELCTHLGKPVVKCVKTEKGCKTSCDRGKCELNWCPKNTKCTTTCAKNGSAVCKCGEDTVKERKEFEALKKYIKKHFAAILVKDKIIKKEAPLEFVDVPFYDPHKCTFRFHLSYLCCPKKRRPFNKRSIRLIVSCEPPYEIISARVIGWRR